MKNKRILFVCQYFYPENISSGILPFELASKLVSEGYKVKVITGYSNEYCDKNLNILKHENLNGMEIIRIKYLTFNRINKFGRILNYFTFCISLCFRFIHFSNIDICITYTNPPFLPFVVAVIKKIKRFKLIEVMYDIYPDAAIKSKTLKKGSLICKIFDSANRYALNKSDKVVALSCECKDYLVSNKDLFDSKVVTIPNWYKDQDFNRTTHKNLNIIYGGNMGIMQDMDTIKQIILSLKENKNITFILCGHGSKKEDIENFIITNDLKNCFSYGYLSKDKYDLLLNSIDLAFVSLEKFAHGLGSPSKAYSYLSKKIPLIVITDSRSEIYNDIKKYNCGIDVDSVESTVNKIIDLSLDKNLLNTLSNNAYKLFKEKYTLDVVCDKYINLLDSL